MKKKKNHLNSTLSKIDPLVCKRNTPYRGGTGNYIWKTYVKEGGEELMEIKVRRRGVQIGKFEVKIARIC